MGRSLISNVYALHDPGEQFAHQGLCVCVACDQIEVALDQDGGLLEPHRRRIIRMPGKRYAPRPEL